MDKEQLLDYFREELNPLFEKSIAADLDEEIDKSINPNSLLPIEAQREKKRQELLKSLAIEEKQTAFLTGLETLERLYPTILDHDEQKRYEEEMAAARKKAAEIVDEEPTNDSVAKRCGITPYSLACMWRVANVTAQNDHLDDALAIYTTILSFDENLTGVATAYAECLQKANRFEEALAAYKKAASLDPDNPLPLIGLTRTCIHQNHADDARHALEALQGLLSRVGSSEEYDATVASLSGEIEQIS